MAHDDLTEGVRHDMKWRAVGISGKWIINSLFATCSIRRIDPYQVGDLMEQPRFIGAFWHSRILLVSYLFQKKGAAIMVSKSEDGEIIAQVLKRQGHLTIRGSSSHGGAKAMAMQIERMKAGPRPGGIIPDGPQGPRNKARMGAITLAQQTGYPILPLTYSAGQIKVFHSWDRFILPYPFTECALVYGRPFKVPADCSREEAEAYRQRLEDELNHITTYADRHYGHDIL